MTDVYVNETAPSHGYSFGKMTDACINETAPSYLTAIRLFPDNFPGDEKII